MRIAIVYWTRRKAGGTEAYLESVIPELLRAGHQVGFWHELDSPTEMELIALPLEVPSWCAAELGVEPALCALREWRPDVIYAHSLMEPELEAETLKIAPAIFFAHAYYGTCISGAKSFKTPTATPCHRRFGWQCMLQYYPRRCGGLSPVTMLKEYRRQSKRLELLSTYKAIVTHSTYMRDEYIKHGFDSARVHCLSYYAHQTGHTLRLAEAQEFADESSARLSDQISSIDDDPHGVEREANRPLLFLGRMDFLKGGQILIDALPRVAESLDRPVHMIFAGDGPERKAWERQAEQIKSERLKIDFIGWINGSQRESLWRECSLLVLPSVWPEPFGLVGPEAGLRGIPIAAFAVGGITDWLEDGVNGHLADGDPPTSAGLAEAIVKCLRDPATHARLRQGALMMARQFNMQNHLAALLDVLESVVQDEATEIKERQRKRV